MNVETLDEEFSLKLHDSGQNKKEKEWDN